MGAAFAPKFGVQTTPRDHQAGEGKRVLVPQPEGEGSEALRHQSAESLGRDTEEGWRADAVEGVIGRAAACCVATVRATVSATRRSHVPSTAPFLAVLLRAQMPFGNTREWIRQGHAFSRALGGTKKLTLNCGWREAYTASRPE
jgi:hypothetical protein